MESRAIEKVEELLQKLREVRAGSAIRLHSGEKIKDEVIYYFIFYFIVKFFIVRSLFFLKDLQNKKNMI